MNPQELHNGRLQLSHFVVAGAVPLLYAHDSVFCCVSLLISLLDIFYHRLRLIKMCCIEVMLHCQPHGLLIIFTGFSYVCPSDSFLIAAPSRRF